MEHMYGFNEEFNWNKLNLFSKKKKEELKEKEDSYDFDDEALARAIFSEIKGKVKGDGITGDGHRMSFSLEHDGDKFLSGSNGAFYVNGEKIKCSKETADKFYQLFKSKQKEYREDRAKNGAKEVKDKLKSKYNKYKKYSNESLSIFI
jgi:hypothetical protein